MTIQFILWVALLVTCLVLEGPQLGSCHSFCINTLSRPSCPDLQTFDQFDISAFGGRWYEIGSNGYFKNLEEAGGTCVTADYSLFGTINSANATTGMNSTIGYASTNSSTSVVNPNVTNGVTNTNSTTSGASATNGTTNYQNGTNAFAGTYRPSGAANATFRLVNSFSKQIGPLATSVVRGISLRAGQICRQARQICIDTHQSGALSQGLADVDTLANQVVQNFSLEGQGLITAKLKIEDAVTRINESLELLSSDISQLQLINSNLSQALGDQAGSVSALNVIAVQSSGEADRILQSVHDIGSARLQVASIAGLLFGISKAEGILFGVNSSQATERVAVELFGAASLIQTAEETIPGPVAVIKATLEGAMSTASMFGLDQSGPAGVSQVQGQIMQPNASQAGKLTVIYDDPPTNETSSLKYWVLAAEGTPAQAVLVYGCHEQPAGGVKQPLFILSRQPTLAQDIVDRFFSVAATLGIDQDCDEPFIFGTQGDVCQYPT